MNVLSRENEGNGRKWRNMGENKWTWRKMKENEGEWRGMKESVGTIVLELHGLGWSVGLDRFDWLGYSNWFDWFGCLDWFTWLIGVLGWDWLGLFHWLVGLGSAHWSDSFSWFTALDSLHFIHLIHCWLACRLACLPAWLLDCLIAQLFCWVDWLIV